MHSFWAFVWLVCLIGLPAGPVKAQQELYPTHQAYQPGEQLEYVLSFGFVKGGRAKLELITTYHKERMYHHARMNAHTTGIMNMLYNVHDRYESYFHPETQVPVTAIRDVEEGPKYKKYNKVHFYPDKKYLESEKTGRMPIPRRTFDVVSVFYAMRNSVFKELRDKTTSFVFHLYYDEKHYQMRVHYRGLETIRTPHGLIECMKFVPLVNVGKVFDSEEDITIWISNDDNYIPVRAEMDILLGAFKAELVNYKGLKHKAQHR